MDICTGRNGIDLVVSDLPSKILCSCPGHEEAEEEQTEKQIRDPHRGSLHPDYSTK
jgi:hypothetical protein